MKHQAPLFLDPSSRSVVLKLPTSVRFRVSPEMFWEIACENPDLRLERTATGRLEVLPPAWTATGRLEVLPPAWTITGAKNASLSGQLWNWNQASGAGVGFGSDVGYTLPNGSVRSPDASWMTWDQWRSMTPEQRKRFPPFCPRFVAELRSHGDRLKVPRRKMRGYRSQGVDLGWPIDLVRKRVEVYRRDRPVEVLDNPAHLSGEALLPGFVLDLSDILADDLLFRSAPEEKRDGNG